MLVSCSLVNFGNLGPTSVVHGFTDSTSYSLNGLLLNAWALIKHPSYARSCAESQGYNNQQGRQSYLGDSENAKVMRNPEREALTETYSLICHLMKSIHSGHPTRLKRSSVPCSIAPAAALPLPHCARSVPPTSTQ